MIYKFFKAIKERRLMTFSYVFLLNCPCRTDKGQFVYLNYLVFVFLHFLIHREGKMASLKEILYLL